MFDNKSDSALNKKDKTALVYRSVTGEINRLTREQFSSEEEFRKWKDVSDDDYEQTEEEGRGYYDNVIASLDDLSENAAATPSAEELFLRHEDELEREQMLRLLPKAAQSCLTKSQYRRLQLYYGKDMDEYKIARAEGVTQQAISKNLAASRIKLKKILKKRL